MSKILRAFALGILATSFAAVVASTTPACAQQSPSDMMAKNLATYYWDQNEIYKVPNQTEVRARFEKKCRSDGLLDNECVEVAVLHKWSLETMHNCIVAARNRLVPEGEKVALNFLRQCKARYVAAMTFYGFPSPLAEKASGTKIVSTKPAQCEVQDGKMICPDAPHVICPPGFLGSCK